MTDKTEWKSLLEAVLREMPGDDGDGNAPGHAHEVPGVWDSDNRPEIAGKPCAWCLAWNAAKAALAAAPTLPAQEAQPPCAGMNCGSTDGKTHSAECYAEHAAAVAGGRFVKWGDEAQPVAWVSHDRLLGKDHYDSVPIQSLQPGVYSHTPLYTLPPDAARRIRGLEAEVQCEQRRFSQAHEDFCRVVAERDRLREALSVLLRDYAMVHGVGALEMQPALNQGNTALGRES